MTLSSIPRKYLYGLFAASLSVQVLLASGAEVTPKKVIKMGSVERAQIELPDQSVHDFGVDLENTLISEFTQSGKYIVSAPFHPMNSGVLSQDYQWTPSVTPSVEISVQVVAMNFQTGTGGEHSFYGFNEHFRTPWNDGKSGQENEFPLRAVTFEPTWFDRTFDVKGSTPFDSASGLDLGDGLSFNLLFAWVSLKYAFYQSVLHLRIRLDSPLLGKDQERLVQVSGSGYFYDFSGGYSTWSAAIQLARKDAMGQALQNAIAGSYTAIESFVQGLPLLARIDAITAQGELLLGTGPLAGVPAGTRYDVVDLPGSIVEVVRSTELGAIGQVVAGNLSLIKPQMLLRESQAAAAKSLAGESLSAASPVQVVLAQNNLPQSNLSGVNISINWADAFLKSLTETIFLPYRIFRYVSYDQTYHAKADGADAPSEPGNALLSANLSWFQSQAQSSWGVQMGLNQVFQTQQVRDPLSAPKEPGARPSPRSGVVVAIIDSGVDYNHPLIHPSLWLNPLALSPTAGVAPAMDRYGWDYFSDDSRPYDDGYHGTQMASAVLSVAPRALILPLKAFNPFGITSSAALFASFQYAVDHGAQMILCGWATRKFSRALELGVAYAQAHGVIVIAAAGDRGDDLAQNPSFPAAFSAKYDNVVSVTSVDLADHLVQVPGHFSNYGAAFVTLAAPGLDVQVAEPRQGLAIVTSTGVAAGLVAGAMARIMDGNVNGEGISAQDTTDYLSTVNLLLSQADRVPALVPSVQGGRRLHLR